MKKFNNKINIVILCAGPPKIGRQRHLEIFNNKPIIDKIIDTCTIKNTSLYIIIHKDNLKLIQHVKNFNCKILIVNDEFIKTTINTAASLKGDCILVCGDLKNIDRKDIQKFVDTEYKSAICRYSIPWGAHIKNNKFLRRADIGDCIVKVSEEHKKEFLSDELWDAGKYYFKQFYPKNTINLKTYNDLGTHHSYAFFYDIWSNPTVNNYKEKGTILFEKKIYDDND